MGELEIKDLTSNMQNTYERLDRGHQYEAIVRSPDPAESPDKQEFSEIDSVSEEYLHTIPQQLGQRAPCHMQSLNQGETGTKDDTVFKTYADPDQTDIKRVEDDSQMTVRELACHGNQDSTIPKWEQSGQTVSQSKGIHGNIHSTASHNDGTTSPIIHRLQQTRGDSDYLEPLRQTRGDSDYLEPLRQTRGDSDYLEPLQQTRGDSDYLEPVSYAPQYIDITDVPRVDQLSPDQPKTNKYLEIDVYDEIHDSTNEYEYVNPTDEQNQRVVREREGTLPLPGEAPGESPRHSRQRRSVLIIVLTVLTVVTILSAGVTLGVYFSFDRQDQSTQVESFTTTMTHDPVWVREPVSPIPCYPGVAITLPWVYHYTERAFIGITFRHGSYVILNKPAGQPDQPGAGYDGFVESVLDDYNAGIKITNCDKFPRGIDSEKIEAVVVFSHSIVLSQTVLVTILTNYSKSDQIIEVLINDRDVGSHNIATSSQIKVPQSTIAVLQGITFPVQVQLHYDHAKVFNPTVSFHTAEDDALLKIYNCQDSPTSGQCELVLEEEEAGEGETYIVINQYERDSDSGLRTMAFQPLSGNFTGKLGLLIGGVVVGGVGLFLLLLVVVCVVKKAGGRSTGN